MVCEVHHEAFLHYDRLTKGKFVIREVGAIEIIVLSAEVTRFCLIQLNSLTNAG